ncbi:MAG: DUF2071 domain-containing protein [Planctomycetaceae bacterium]|nr:DUF2071 domain-containing protein [Planctomycetaceae bacterium]
MDFAFLAARAHRSAPWPAGPWVLRMAWHGLLFAHWEVPAAAVAERLPAGLELDTFAGRAYVGVVPFEMRSVGPRRLPGMPTARQFPELNVRTYVLFRGQRAVWFFSLDAASALAVWGARALFHLPYFRARMHIETRAEGFRYTSERIHRGAPPAEFAADFGPVGDRFVAEPGSLEHWLTERYSLVAANGRGKLREGPIHHRPWPLQRAVATIERNTMGACHGFDLSAAPDHLLYADHLDVVAWALR